MKIPFISRSKKTNTRSKKGFTLVEILVASSIGLAVLGAVAATFVLTARLIFKNQQISDAVSNSRLVQEHLKSEFSVAISQTTPTNIRPTFSDDSTGLSPTRHGCVTYRVAVGSFATVNANTACTSNTITIACPADVVPQIGDYLLMDTPNLGTGIRITDAPGTAGTITVTLASTLYAGSSSADQAKNVGATANSLVVIHRERKYLTVPPTDPTNPVTQLLWYSTTAPGGCTPLVLSNNVDASARYLFAQVPEDPSPTVPATESALSWQFSYVNSSTSTPLVGGNNSSFYQTNYMEGMIIPKSGNPLNTASLATVQPLFTTTTLATTTAGTTTAATTTAGTTTAGTTTAGTTTAGTTTKGSTTTAGTTTAGTTTKGTTTKGTTTKGTTTAGTSTAGSTTTAGTTTAGTTTAGSTTTAGTTTAGTTTAGTTTKGTTTKGTTTAGTTTAGTTTAGSTTTAGTTTAGTTTKGTTTAGTTTAGTTTAGTTTAGTTTAGTTTSATTTSGSTTTAGTTTINFDG